MRASNIKILLIGKSEETNKHIIEIIKKQGFIFNFVDDIEMAIQSIIEELPDIIISFYELNDLNAFQVYNILNRKFLRNEIPFIIIFDHYKKNIMMGGLELGIDSFILPPYDPERIGNIIRRQLTKNNDRKAAGIIKFDSRCKTLSYGIFVAENKRIVETNEMFDRLIDNVPRQNGIYFVNEIFYFDPENEDELKFSRVLNGLTKYCIFNEIRIRGRYHERYNLYFSMVKNRGSSSKVVGIVIPAKVQVKEEQPTYVPYINSGLKPDYVDPNLITSRERQVLELSATGCPIRQIAERLGISERTVEKHRSNIIQKTKTENIMEAVFMFGKNHLLNI